MLTLTAGAPDRAPTFNWHVDPSAGNDSTGTGTKALPYLTLSKAHTVASAGQSVGMLAGSTHRLASTLSLTKRLRIGAYGTGARPIISGGTLATGWSAAYTGVPSSDLLTGGNLDTWTTTTACTGWTTTPTILREDTLFHSGSHAVRIASGGVAGKLQQSISLTANAHYAFSAWYFTDTVGKNISYQISITSGTNSGQFLQDNGTWGAAHSIVTTNSQTYKNVTQSFVMANQTATVQLTLQSYDGGTYNGYWDDAQLGPNTLSGSIFSAALATQPAGVTWTHSGTTVGLVLGASAAALTSNQYYWASNVLTVNVGGDPTGDAVDAATTTILLNIDTVDGMVFRGLGFRHGADQMLKIANSQGTVVDNCAFRYTWYVANSGNLVIQNGSTAGTMPTRVCRNAFDHLMNDNIWVYNTQNVQIDHNTISYVGWLAGDVQSDGIQIEDYFGTTPNSSGLWIHHNNIDMTFTSSPKGCIVFNGSGAYTATENAVIEYNTLVGGNYGMGLHSGNTVFRYNVCLNQVSAFGGGIHVDSGGGAIDSVDIHHNLIAGSSRAGIIVQTTGTARTNWRIMNNTIVNSAWAQVYLGAPMSGIFKNNILWYSGTAPTFTTLNIGSATGGGFVSDYNDLGTAWTNYLTFNAVSQSTLAAWRSAGQSYDAHSIAGDPLFADTVTYPLGATSPAIDAGLVISGITDGYLGANPDLGWVEKA